MDRRDFLRTTGLGAVAGHFLVTKDLLASVDDGQIVSQTVSEHARPTEHPAEAFRRPRWTTDRTGPYDLSDPLDNHYAFAKVQANLVGKFTWLAQYGWIVLCPPNEPAYPFLGRLTVAKVFVTPADPALVENTGLHDYMLWGTFTTTHVDPRTYTPVDRIYNPYIGRQIDVPTIHYADRLVFRLGQSIVVPGVDPAFYAQPWDADGGFSQHHIDAGQDVTYTVLGSAQKPGPQQPRCDVGFWTVSRDDLMNPTLGSIDTRRDYSVIQKMTEYSWYGAEPGDQAQLLVHLTGTKTENVARLPSFIHEHVLQRFKARFQSQN